MSVLQVIMPHAGGTEALRLQRREAPAPGRGQARVRVEAAGVAFAEVQMLRGRYYAQPTFPFVPGYDLVGRVDAVGPDVTTPRVGQLRPEIAARLPLSKAATALQLLVDRAATGKVVLLPQRQRAQARARTSRGSRPTSSTSASSSTSD